MGCGNSSQNEVANSNKQGELVPVVPAATQTESSSSSGGTTESTPTKNTAEDAEKSAKIAPGDKIRKVVMVERGTWESKVLHAEGYPSKITYFEEIAEKLNRGRQSSEEGEVEIRSKLALGAADGSGVNDDPAVVVVSPTGDFSPPKGNSSGATNRKEEEEVINPLEKKPQQEGKEEEERSDANGGAGEKNKKKKKNIIWVDDEAVKSTGAIVLEYDAPEKSNNGTTSGCLSRKDILQIEQAILQSPGMEPSAAAVIELQQERAELASKAQQAAQQPATPLKRSARDAAQRSPMASHLGASWEKAGGDASEGSQSGLMEHSSSKRSRRGSKSGIKSPMLSPLLAMASSSARKNREQSDRSPLASPETKETTPAKRNGKRGKEVGEDEDEDEEFQLDDSPVNSPQVTDSEKRKQGENSDMNIKEGEDGGANEEEVQAAEDRAVALQAAQLDLVAALWNPGFREGRLEMMEEHLVSAKTMKKSQLLASGKQKHGAGGATAIHDSSSCEGWCVPSLTVVSREVQQNRDGVGSPQKVPPPGQEDFLGFFLNPEAALSDQVVQELFQLAGGDDLPENLSVEDLVNDYFEVRLELGTVREEDAAIVIEEEQEEALFGGSAPPEGGIPFVETCQISLTAPFEEGSSTFKVVTSADMLASAAKASTDALMMSASASFLKGSRGRGDKIDGGVNSDGENNNTNGLGEDPNTDHVQNWTHGRHRWTFLPKKHKEGGDGGTKKVHSTSTPYSSWIVQLGAVPIPGTLMSISSSNSEDESEVRRILDPVEKAEFSSLERNVSSVLSGSEFAESSAELVKKMRRRLKEARKGNTTGNGTGTTSLDNNLVSEEEVNKRFPEYAGRIKLVLSRDEDEQDDEKQNLCAARLSKCPILTPGGHRLHISLRIAGSASDGSFPFPLPQGDGDGKNNNTPSGGIIPKSLNVTTEFSIKFIYRFSSVLSRGSKSGTMKKKTERGGGGAWSSLVLDAVPTTDSYGFISKVEKTVYRTYEGFLCLAAEQKKTTHSINNSDDDGGLVGTNILLEPPSSSDPSASSDLKYELLEDGLLEYYFTLSSKHQQQEAASPSTVTMDQNVITGFVSGQGDETSVFPIVPGQAPDLKTKALFLLGACFPSY